MRLGGVLFGDIDIGEVVIGDAQRIFLFLEFFPAVVPQRSTRLSTFPQ